MTASQLKNGKQKKKHIDDVQPATVDEHYRVLLADEELISPKIVDVTPDDLPDWYDEKLFQAGQNYYENNLLSITVGTLSGLIATFAFPSILKVLCWTKQSSTPCTAFRRYLETNIHVHNLYNIDLKDGNSRWWKSLATIRAKHCNSSRRSHQGGAGGITHRDMALTQYGFLGYILCNPETLGLTNRPEEREALNHFWRVQGHMLGISDRLNLCRKTVAETTELCKRLQEMTKKYYDEKPPNFIDMTVAMLDGMWCVDFMIDIEAVLAFTYGLHGLQYKKTLGWYSWINLYYRYTILYLIGLPVIGAVIRTYFEYFLKINYWILERWQVVAWIRFGKAESKINVFPKLTAN